MNKVGVIVVTNVGAAVCEQALSNQHIAFISDGNHNESAYIEAGLTGDWDTVAQLISESIKRLQVQGADLFIMPANTTHYAYEQVMRQHPDIEFLNLIELTAQACLDRHLNKVAILGTKATMQGDLYDQALADRHIEKVTPDHNTQAQIHALIFDEIILKGDKSDPVKIEAVKDSIIALKEKSGCDGVILGCTELPVVFNDQILGMPSIDTSRLLPTIIHQHYCPS